MREWRRKIEGRALLRRKKAVVWASTRECGTGKKVLTTREEMNLENSSVLSSDFLSLE